MFKFGFSSDKSEAEINYTSSKEWYKAEKINPHTDINYTAESAQVNTFVCNEVILNYISPDSVIEKLKQDSENSNVILADINHSDLKPAEYEGGLKIWECTKDLINYLSKERIVFSNKKVLDLGCGAGLLGVFALLNGAHVDFQDYNKEVIQHTTIPNAALNLKNFHHLIKTEKCNFFAGDWKHFMNINSTKYEYILTSETIYNPENYEKMFDLFYKNLAESGTIYLAGKTYYFGVGGGIRQFEDLLNKRKEYSSTVCWKFPEGVQREILRIQKI